VPAPERLISGNPSFKTWAQDASKGEKVLTGVWEAVQGTDMETVRAVAARIRSGQVHLNYPDWDPNAPFGGYKRSGNGREYGVEGLEEYLETKAVLGFYR